MPNMWDNYNNNGFNGYNNTMPIHSQIVKVNGAAGARSFRLAPNSSILLLDENEPIVWFVQTDGAGYSNPVPYDISPHQVEQPIDLTQLENRLKKIEEILNEQSNYRASKQTKSKQQQQSASE